jgi:hypothetical protein
MAFPQIAATGVAGFGVAAGLLNLPANIAAGNLLIATLLTGPSGAGVTWPAGWTEISDDFLTDILLSHAYRIADGVSDGTTVTVTLPAGGPRHSGFVYRITDWHGVTPPEVGSVANGNSLTPDSPSLTPSWGAADTLWISSFIHTTAGVPTFTEPSSYDKSKLTDVTTNRYTGGVVGRERNAASENPGNWTLEGVAAAIWLANTVAVRPAVTARAKSQSAGVII